MDNKKRRSMLGLISVLVFIAGLAVSYGFFKRRHGKRAALNDAEADNSNEGVTLDKVYDDLLTFEPDSESSNENDTKSATAPAVMKLKDRTSWNIYKKTVLPGIIIISFAAAIAIISVLGQKAYNERKHSEEAVSMAEQATEKAAVKERQDAEDRRMDELSKQLDSIDSHIKQLRIAPIRTNKKKSGK